MAHFNPQQLGDLQQRFLIQELTRRRIESERISTRQRFERERESRSTERTERDT